VCAVGVGGKVEHVSGAAADYLVCEFVADRFAECFDDFVDGGADLSTQVPCADTGLLVPEVVEREQVTLCKIENVDVVTDGGSVSAVVVVTEDHELFPLANGDLCCKWKKVEWDSLWVLAHDSAWVGTGWVEVAEKSAVPLATILALFLCECPLGIDEICDEQLDGVFCVSIWVCWAKRAVLWNWNHIWEAGGITVNGGRGGEDNVGNVVLLHGTKKGDGTANIDAEVLLWDLGRLANSL